MFNREIDAIAPFLPRPDVVADARIAEKPQGEIGVRGTIAALAVGHDLSIGRDPCGLVHRPELLDWLERAVRTEIPGPFDVNRAGNRAAAGGAHRCSAVLAVAARVDDRAAL